ncbi:MAG: DUF2339 domain-containing protein [Chloroflexota bacterium]
MGDLEALLSGRILAWIGGIALVIAAAFFLSLAFSRGWIGSEARVLLGIGGGGILLAVSGWLFERRSDVVAHVTVAVGLAVISLALYAATRLYGMVDAPVALAGSLLASIGAAAIAIRNRSQAVGAFGLLAVLAAPPILGAQADLTTIAYFGLVLAGTTAISLARGWVWLPALGFILAAPQAASWFADASATPISLFVVVAFWAVNATGAAGDAVRLPGGALRPSSATLLVGAAAFLIWSGLVVLDGDAVSARGLFLVFVAVVHGLLAGFFLLREGDRHPFGLLAAGTGVAALTLAVPVQLSGPLIPLAWAAEAAALAWVSGLRRHGYAASAAAVLGALAILHLLTVEYGVFEFVRGPLPFGGSSGLTLAFVVGAFVVGAWAIRDHRIGAILLTIGFLLIGYAATFELDGPARLALWVALAVAALALDRTVGSLLPRYDRSPLRAVPGVDRSLGGAWAVLAGAAGAFLLDLMPPWQAPNMPTASIPFVDEAGLVTGIAVAGLLLSGLIAGRGIVLRAPQTASLIGTAVLIAYVALFEMRDDAVVVVWSSLAGGLLAVGRWAPGIDRLATSWTWRAAAGLAVAGVALAVLSVATLDRLVVDQFAIDAGPLRSGLSGAAGALVTLSAVVALNLGLSLTAPNDVSRRWTAVTAGMLALYLVSILVVDLFRVRIGGLITSAELATQAQVALSVTWILLGAVIFGLGARRRLQTIRVAGLGLLALATTKVFVVDLSAVDVAYRVISLAVLGLLLLATAYVAGRASRTMEGDLVPAAEPSTGDPEASSADPPSEP